MKTYREITHLSGDTGRDISRNGNAREDQSERSMESSLSG